MSIQIMTSVDEQTGRQILSELSAANGTSMPQPHGGSATYIGPTPTGILGFYCAECGKTIRVNPGSFRQVFVHEYIHHFVHEKGIQFPTEDSEEAWVRAETDRVSAEMGIAPRTYREQAGGVILESYSGLFVALIFVGTGVTTAYALHRESRKR